MTFLPSGGASFSLQHRLQPMSGERRLKPALQTEVRASLLLLLAATALFAQTEYGPENGTLIIVGGGKVGTYLTRALLKEDHEVVVIEKDPKKAQMMTNLLETDVAIVGDGCDPIVLSQAGLSRADVVVADTGDDEDNLVVCLITKKQSKARCIARVNNPKNKLIFESLDKEDPVIVISSTEVILNIIDEQVNTRDLASLVTLGKGELELIKLTIARD